MHANHREPRSELTQQNYNIYRTETQFLLAYLFELGPLLRNYNLVVAWQCLRAAAPFARLLPLPQLDSKHPHSCIPSTTDGH